MEVRLKESPWRAGSASNTSAELSGERYGVSSGKLVSLISRDMTLEPGDVIACGASLGVGPMKPDSKVRVVIAGIGEFADHIE